MEFATKLETIVNIQEDVNVCIVCHPLVVIVPPVDVLDTPSDPSVAYEIITTHEPPVPHEPDPQPPQPPQPVFAVHAVHAVVNHEPPQPPQPVPHDPFDVNSDSPPPQPPAYVIALPDIEFVVPAPPLPEFVENCQSCHTAQAPHPHQTHLRPVFDAPPAKPCEAVPPDAVLAP